jgi:hypothetical protein
LAEGAERANHRILDDIFGQDRVAGQVAGKVIGAIEVREDELIELLGLAGAGL